MSAAARLVRVARERIRELLRSALGARAGDFRSSLDAALARDDGVTLRVSALERAVAARSDRSQTASNSPFHSSFSQED